MKNKFFLIYFFVFLRILFEIHILTSRLILTQIDYLIFIFLILFFSLITPLGIVTGIFLTHFFSFRILSFFFSFSGGIFIYVSIIKCILEEFQIGKDQKIKFLFIFIGLLICSLLF